MTSPDLPPTHRRAYRLWQRPNFAQDEWGQLTTLSEDLQNVSSLLTEITQGLRPDMPGHARITRMSASLRKMSDRWARRADKAREDAIADAGGDKDWEMKQEARIWEASALSAMGRALQDLDRAAASLRSEPPAAERVRALKTELEALCAELYGRDPLRPWYGL